MHFANISAFLGTLFGTDSHFALTALSAAVMAVPLEVHSGVSSTAELWYPTLIKLLARGTKIFTWDL